MMLVHYYGNTFPMYDEKVIRIIHSAEHILVQKTDLITRSKYRGGKTRHADPSVSWKKYMDSKTNFCHTPYAPYGPNQT
jgi:hypothetical protein